MKTYSSAACNVTNARGSRDCTTGAQRGQMAPGQETNLAPPCSNVRSLGSKRAVEKSICDIVGTFGRPHAVIRRPHSDSAPGELRPPCPPSLRHCCTSLHLLVM